MGLSSIGNSSATRQHTDFTPFKRWSNSMLRPGPLSRSAWVAASSARLMKALSACPLLHRRHCAYSPTALATGSPGSPRRTRKIAASLSLYHVTRSGATSRRRNVVANR
ncbi:hypothetical protein DIPPA_09288 [Diplonema papillatum]|nr:hypothetical protein DIPPA_09530 [Diplonema papillatum]KAJ9448014.1 hypothetical protein DIPPA_09288 [Diplonema papillatum]